LPPDLPTPADAQAHAQCLNIVGATLPPRDEWGNADAGGVGEVTRQAVNHWIRTSGEYDAVADFDLATRHPENPLRLLPEYDSGDGIHLSDAGNQAMADAVDVRQLIEGSPSRSRCARRR
jgi:lysophospholipase L1-like esterase